MNTSTTPTPQNKTVQGKDSSSTDRTTKFEMVSIGEKKSYCGIEEKKNSCCKLVIQFPNVLSAPSWSAQLPISGDILETTEMNAENLAMTCNRFHSILFKVNMLMQTAGEEIGVENQGLINQFKGL